MKIGSLSLFYKLHSNGKTIPGIGLMSWHSYKSITWRWLLNWYPLNQNHKPFLVRTHTYDKGLNFKACLIIPFIGYLKIETQPTMLRKK